MKKLIIASVATLFAPFALAGADCTAYPKSEWMSEFDLQKKIINEYGFAISRFKVDDECYEIYGWEKGANGEKVKIEVYFDAKTGAIVKKK